MEGHDGGGLVTRQTPQQWRVRVLVNDFPILCVSQLSNPVTPVSFGTQLRFSVTKVNLTLAVG